MWRLLLVLAGCDFGLTLDAVDAPGGDPPPGTVFRRSIDITDALVTGTHTSFPIVVDLEGDWLRSTASGGHVATAEGNDIRFSTDPDGAELLVHDVEVYMPVQGRLIAWISVPALAPSTVLYMHYGDPAWMPPGDPRTVWTTPGYGAVWHLHPSNTDASGQNSTFTDMSMVTNGKIAAGRQFDAMDAYIDVGSDASIDDVFEGGATVEAWFRATTEGENNAGRILEKGNWLLFVSSGEVRFIFTWTAAFGDWSAPISLNTWHHVAVNYTRGSAAATIYLDGVDATAVVGNPNGTPQTDGLSALRIGNRSTLDRAFDGVLDEIRISTAARTPEWIATSYRNQNDPRAFSTLGAEEPR